MKYLDTVMPLSIVSFFSPCKTDSVKSLPTEIQPRNLLRFDAILPIAAKYFDNISDVQEKVRQVLDVNADLEKELMVQV